MNAGGQCSDAVSYPGLYCWARMRRGGVTDCTIGDNPPWSQVVIEAENLTSDEVVLFYTLSSERSSLQFIVNGQGLVVHVGNMPLPVHKSMSPIESIHWESRVECRRRQEFIGRFDSLRVGAVVHGGYDDQSTYSEFNRGMSIDLAFRDLPSVGDAGMP